LNPYRIKNEWTDCSQVKKFEISEEEYNKRNGKIILKFYLLNNMETIKTFISIYQYNKKKKIYIYIYIKNNIKILNHFN